MYGYKPILGMTDFPVNNMVTNGEFKNELGWSNGGYGTIAVTAPILTFTFGSNLPSISTSFMINDNCLGFNTVISHKYYIKINVLPKHNGKSRFTIGGDSPFANDIVANQWNISSVVATVNSVSRQVAFFSDISTTGYVEGDKIDFKGLVVVDLTTTFGIGNEPTVEEMDELMTYFPNSWFNGTVNLADYKWFMVYLLNQIRALKTAVVGLGGTV